MIICRNLMIILRFQSISILKISEQLNIVHAGAVLNPLVIRAFLGILSSFLRLGPVNIWWFFVVKTE